MLLQNGTFDKYVHVKNNKRNNTAMKVNRKEEKKVFDRKGANGKK
jgi:hypothetical protein